MTTWLQATARANPDRLAVADRSARLTYGELLDAAREAAEGLDAGPGELVEIDLPPGVEYAVELHGAFLAGAIARPLAAPAGPAEIHRVGDLERARRPGGHAMALITTSGTSGEPKPVLLTRENFEASARASAARLGVEPDDRWLCCLPLYHVGGLSILIRAAIHGTAAVVEPGFDADRVAALMDAGEATAASLVPTQLVRLLDAGAPLGRPRLLLVGGGPLPADVLEESLGRGATVVQTYGLTEACSQVCTLGPEEARERAGSAGRPLEGTEVRIEDGEILVRGPTVAPGAAAADGWLHTGDLGRLDGDGYLWVEGRRDDLIVTGGENVRPERVEAVLREHPAVADVAVAGRDDREWGQAVVAFVVPGPSAEPDEAGLIAHAREHLARHEVPKRVVLVEELPRTASGKLLRREIQG